MRIKFAPWGYGRDNTLSEICHCTHYTFIISLVATYVSSILSSCKCKISTHVFMFLEAAGKCRSEGVDAGLLTAEILEESTDGALNDVTCSILRKYFFQSHCVRQPVQNVNTEVEDTTSGDNGSLKARRFLGEFLESSRAFWWLKIRNGKGETKVGYGDIDR